MASRIQFLPAFPDFAPSFRGIVQGQFRFLLQVWIAAIVVLHAAGGWAAPPNVTNVSPRGLQIGATTAITVDGAGLLPEPRIVSSLPIAKQEVREGATDKRVQIAVTLDPATPPGIYQIYLATAEGISLPVAIGVDALPQLPQPEKLSDLNVALHGSVTGSTIVRTSFAGKSGERVAIDVEARRLGSSLNPVLRLYDDRKIEVDWAQGRSSIAGDARLDVKLPRDGEYTVELHDALYRGGNPGHYRLKIGQLHYADLAYPLGVQRGQNARIEFAGANFPAGTSVDFAAPPLPHIAAAPWPALSNLTAGRPALIVSDLPEVLEGPASAGEPQRVAVPAAMNGRLAAPDEEDQYLLEVTPGSKLRFDVLAARAGSPVDGVLTIKGVNGNQLATGDDRPGTTDPGLDFNVPGNAKQVIVAVKDLHGRDGPDCIYRIAVTPADQPGFSLAATEGRLLLPQSGNALMRVRAARTGYNGPIKLSFGDLPMPLSMSVAEIPAGVNEVLATLAPGEGAAGQSLAQLWGEAADPIAGTRRAAELPENPINKHQPWFRSELALAITPAAPIQLTWETADLEPTLTLGGSMPVLLRATRGDAVRGPIRISLLTSQVVPKKSENNRQVDDVAKAIRLETPPMIPIDQAVVETKVLVPADLPILPYDLVFQGELLSLDGKNVVATVYATGRRLSPVKPAP
jgi:hypothetical protein